MNDSRLQRIGKPFDDKVMRKVRELESVDLDPTLTINHNDDYTIRETVLELQKDAPDPIMIDVHGFKFSEKPAILMPGMRFPAQETPTRFQIENMIQVLFAARQYLARCASHYSFNETDRGSAIGHGEEKPVPVVIPSERGVTPLIVPEGLTGTYAELRSRLNGHEHLAARVNTRRLTQRLGFVSDVLSMVLREEDREVDPEMESLGEVIQGAMNKVQGHRISRDETFHNRLWITPHYYAFMPPTRTYEGPLGTKEIAMDWAEVRP